MRMVVGLAFAFLSIIAAVGAGAAVVALPLSLREFWGELNETVFVVSGTLLLAALASAWLRGALHAFRRVRVRQLLDRAIPALFLVLSVLSVGLGAHGDLKSGAGYYLGAVFVASALGYRSITRRDGAPPNRGCSRRAPPAAEPQR